MRDVLGHTNEIALDLQQTFRIDLTPEVLETRPWVWLRRCILDLLNHPSRLRTALNIPPEVTTSF